MKKVILLSIMLITLCGCTNIKELTHDEVIKTLNVEAAKANKYRTGYKYYLPRDMKVLNSTRFNEILSNGHETFYLYVDALSYKNNIQDQYTPTNKSYYSKSISFDDKYGYVEINFVENEKYLIEIMYNYAKIEVMVEKDYINKALHTSISILKSVQYNDNIIANLFGEDILNFAEEEFNIFHTTSSDSTYIQIDNTYQETEEEVHDTDLIK